jgi:hypothetical protein
MADPQGGIFISYRREEAQGWATHLHKDLSQALPGRRIFYAPQSIQGGELFADSIRRALEACSVTLVLIGPHWLVVQDDRGNRRIDNPRDWVHVEVLESLRRPGLRVVPVLLGGARIPTEPELPDALKALAGRQAHEISDRRWDYDVGQLVAMLRAPRRLRGPLIAAATAVTAAGLAGYLAFGGRLTPEPSGVVDPTTGGPAAPPTSAATVTPASAPIELEVAMQKGAHDLTGPAGSHVGAGRDGVVRSIVVRTKNLPPGLVLKRDYFYLTDTGSNDGGGPIMLATSTGPGVADDRFEHPKGLRGVRFWLEGPGADKYIVRYGMALTPDGRSSEARNGGQAGDWSPKTSSSQHQLVWLSLSIDKTE